MTTTPTLDTIHLRLVDLTERKGQKLTARDVATARMAIAALSHLRDEAANHWRVYGNTLSTSVDRGIQLDAVREMLVQIKEIIE